MSIGEPLPDQPQAQPVAANGSSTARASWRLRWLVYVPVALILLVAALPTIVGSRWFYQPLVDRLAIQGFQLQIDKVEIRWLQPLALRGIHLKQMDAPKLDQLNDRSAARDVIEIKAIESNRSLVGYLLGGRNLGQLRIIEPRVDIEMLEDTSNLEKLFEGISNNATGEPPKPATRPAQVDLVIEVEGMSVSVTGSGSEASELLLVIPPFDTKIEYLARDQQPLLIVSPSRVLDHVTVSPELVRLGLGRAIPLLAKSAWFDGSVSLETERVEIPIDRPHASRGRGTLTLHEVRTGPSEPLVFNILETIAKLRGKDPVYELVFIDGSRIDVTATNGMIDHRGVQIGLPKIDPRLQISSAGRVGIIQQELDLQVGIPVPIEMVARRESVQRLGVPQISLPIRGTIDKPVIDWASMRQESSDLIALIAAALGQDAPGSAAAFELLGAATKGEADGAIGAAVDWLKELRRLRLGNRATGSNPAPDNETSAEETGDRPAPSAPRRPLRDALKNLRGG